MAGRASVFRAKERFARLRRRIAEIEGGPASSYDRRTLLPFGIERLDHLLAGGLRRDTLHEIRSETTRDSIAATGFAFALLARLADQEARRADGPTGKQGEEARRADGPLGKQGEEARKTGGLIGKQKDLRPLLLVIEASALSEAGEPYGPGLDRFGLDSRRLVIVQTRRPSETLWVFEEALRCRGLAAVLAEIRGHPHQLDLTASRRLALRARENGVMGLLLRQASAAEPGASATRWHVSPRPASTIDDFASGIGHPVWHLALEHNRTGPIGTFDLEWNHGTRAFASAAPIRPALSLTRAPLSGDRPNPPIEAGAVVALRRVS
jgi:protein ImuA